MLSISTLNKLHLRATFLDIHWP